MKNFKGSKIKSIWFETFFNVIFALKVKRRLTFQMWIRYSLDWTIYPWTRLSSPAKTGLLIAGHLSFLRLFAEEYYPFFPCFLIHLHSFSLPLTPLEEPHQLLHYKRKNTKINPLNKKLKILIKLNINKNFKLNKF